MTKNHTIKITCSSCGANQLEDKGTHFLCPYCGTRYDKAQVAAASEEKAEVPIVPEEGKEILGFVFTVVVIIFFFVAAIGMANNDVDPDDALSQAELQQLIDADVTSDEGDCIYISDDGTYVDQDGESYTPEEGLEYTDHEGNPVHVNDAGKFVYDNGDPVQPNDDLDDEDD